MRDEFAQVAGKDAARIMLKAVRLSALAVRAKVGHDYAKAFAGDPVRVPELDPVHVRVLEEAMQQDDGPALPDLVIGELHTVGRGPEMNCGLAHAPTECQRPCHIATCEDVRSACRYCDARRTRP